MTIDVSLADPTSLTFLTERTTSAMQTLPPSIAREAYSRICSSLPPPVPDTPETRAARNESAMMAVADLRPATAYEARLAVEIVAADAHVMDSLRLAARHCDEIDATLRCRAQATAMMRQVRSTRLMLEREQMARPKVAASVPAETHAAPPQTAPEPAPPPDPIYEAEKYAVMHTDDAARIRANGRQRLPIMTGLDPAITPPDPAIVEALINGTTSVLRELDAIALELAEAA
jgi:hypothetical protein